MQQRHLGPDQPPGHGTTAVLFAGGDNLQQGVVLLRSPPGEPLEELVEPPLVRERLVRNQIALRAGTVLPLFESGGAPCGGFHQRGQRHPHHLARGAHVIIGHPLPEEPLGLPDQQTAVVKNLADAFDVADGGRAVVQTPHDARIVLAAAPAERHGDGHPLAQGHPFGHGERVEGLRQRQKNIGERAHDPRFSEGPPRGRGPKDQILFRALKPLP